MISLGIASDVDKLAAKFDQMSQRQVPFATSLALNRCAKLAKDTVQTQLSVIFDRPTPYTLNSLFVRFSTKTNLVARLEHKEFAGKGVPASLYLKAEIEGGARAMKRSEKLLGHYWEPSQFVQLDQYGNVPGPLMVKILSTLQQFPENGYRANMTDKTKAARIKKGNFYNYFIMPAGNPRGLKPGVYFRTPQGKELPILFFVDKPPVYKPVYDMASIVNRVVGAEFDRQFAAAMDYALSTAKVTL